MPYGDLNPDDFPDASPELRRELARLTRRLNTTRAWQRGLLPAYRPTMFDLHVS